MFLSLTPAQIPAQDETLRAQVRAFVTQALAGIPPERRARSWLAYDAEFSRKIGQKGWLGLTLPKKYGGHEHGPFARFVVAEELLAAGAPVAAHWIADRQSGPLILRYGTETQKQFYLPGICRGEAFFCIGMSEPGSGSDLASVRSRASKADKGWILNGSKIWTSNADRCHYMIALVRSSGGPEDRQAGLSQFIIDLSLPGISVKPIVDLTGESHFCEVHFNDVQLPEDALIGQEGAGWAQVTAELAFERSGPERIYSSLVLLDTWIRHLRDHVKPSSAAIVLVGRLVGELAVLRELSIAVTARLAAGESPTIEASLVKDMGTSFEQKIPARLAEILAAEPDIPINGPLLRTLSYVTQISPAYSLRGGTREILRGIIARGLGLR